MEFKGYKATIHDHFGNITENIDMSVENCLNMGMEEYKIPHCPLAAAKTALDLSKIDSIWKMFYDGDVEVDVQETDRSNTRETYNASKMDYELELERIAG